MCACVSKYMYVCMYVCIVINDIEQAHADELERARDKDNMDEMVCVCA